MFKKGQRVCWLNENRDGLKHGTVKKGGSKNITVIQDGAEYQVRGDAWKHGNFTARIDSDKLIGRKMLVIDQVDNAWNVEPGRVVREGAPEYPTYESKLIQST